MHHRCLLQGTLSQSSSDYHATRSLGAVARKAQELLKRQRQIDQDVSRQWGDTRAAGASWAGQVHSNRRHYACASCTSAADVLVPPCMLPTIGACCRTFKVATSRYSAGC